MNQIPQSIMNVINQAGKILNPLEQKLAVYEQESANDKQIIDIAANNLVKYEELNDDIERHDSRSRYNPKKWMSGITIENKITRKNTLEEELTNTNFSNYSKKQTSITDMLEEITLSQKKAISINEQITNQYKEVFESAKENPELEIKKYLHNAKKELGDIITKNNANAKILSKINLANPNLSDIQELTPEEENRLKNFHKKSKDFMEAVQTHNLMDILIPEYKKITSRLNNLNESFLTYQEVSIQLKSEIDKINKLKIKSVETDSLINELPEPQISETLPEPVSILPISNEPIMIGDLTQDFIDKKKEYYQSTCSDGYNKKSYKVQLEDFMNPYLAATQIDDKNIESIATILAGKYSINGKRVWKWSDRINEVEKITSNSDYNSDQIGDLNRLNKIVNKNSYLKRKHKEGVSKLSNMLTSEVKLQDKPKNKQQTNIETIIEEPVTVVVDPIITNKEPVISELVKPEYVESNKVNDEEQYITQKNNPIEKSKTKSVPIYKSLWRRAKKLVLPIAAAALLTFMVKSDNQLDQIDYVGATSIKPVVEQVQTTPNKQINLEKQIIQDNLNNKFTPMLQNHIYTVEQGSTLWSITKNYLESKNVEVNDKLIYDTVDYIAGINGKGKQADYEIGIKDSKSPHYLQIGETIIIPDGAETVLK